jgi:anti-sigma regulatory factor (Ser/Thr protein kinase)
MVTGQAARSAAMPDKPAVGGGLNHQAFFYCSRRDYLARIQAFAGAGAASGEPVLIAVPGHKGSVLRDQLGGQVGYTDMERLGRNPARIIPHLREFIDAYPGQPVRCVSEAIWPGRSAAEICEATRHEALTNLAFSSTAATILCPYDAEGLPPAVVSAAERVHRHAGRGSVPPECDRPLLLLPATAEALGYESDLRPVRRLVDDHACRAGLSDERAANLVLAASEIAGNTLRHTSAGGIVHVWHTEEEILCQIQDQGWITDPLAGRIRRPPDESGHGLWVVNQMCDLAEIRTGEAGTTIRMHMSIQEL